MTPEEKMAEALKVINHNTTAIRESLVKHSAEHVDMISEMKRTNDNWFKVMTLMIIGLFLLVGVKLGGII